MRSLEIEPTKENIIKVFEEDNIGRSKDVLRFVELINSLSSSETIALDAPWGSGKTFFIRQAQFVIEAYNSSECYLNGEEKKRIKDVVGRFEEQDSRLKVTNREPAISVYFDAWENDNNTDPLLSLVSNILQAYESEDTFKNSASRSAIVKETVSAIINRNINLKNLEPEDLLEQVKENAQLKERIAKFFDELRVERANRLVIFIDELDRCRPDFAVSLLERIKHYFTNKNITFVFSTNGAELQNAVKKIYGNEFNASRYLDRFFDFQIGLKPLDVEQYFGTLGYTSEEYLYFINCKNAVKIFHLEMREASRLLKMAEIIGKKALIDESYPRHWDSELLGRRFILETFIPLMLALRITDKVAFDSFIKGENPESLYKVYKDEKRSLKKLLDSNETYDSESQGSEIKVETKEKLSLVYNYIFNRSEENKYEEPLIGKCVLDRGLKEYLLDYLNLFSMEISFN